MLLALASESAEAHANLVESDPAVNSVLPESPDGVTIRFTEPLEPALSEIRVLDAMGRRVDNGDSKLDPNDPHLMSVSVESLENGTYTVAWKNVSTVDGHRVRGAFVFSVGEPISPAASPSGLEQSLLQSPAEPVVRWTILLGVLTTLGGMTFLLLVARPALAALAIQSESVAALRHVLTWGITGTALITSTTLLAASVVQLMSPGVRRVRNLRGRRAGRAADLAPDRNRLGTALDMARAARGVHGRRIGGRMEENTKRAGVAQWYGPDLPRHRAGPRRARNDQFDEPCCRNPKREDHGPAERPGSHGLGSGMGRWPAEPGHSPVSDVRIARRLREAYCSDGSCASVFDQSPASASRF